MAWLGQRLHQLPIPLSLSLSRPMIFDASKISTSSSWTPQRGNTLMMDILAEENTIDQTPNDLKTDKCNADVVENKI